MVAETSAGCLATDIFMQSCVALITIKIILFRQKRKLKWNKYVFYLCPVPVISISKCTQEAGGKYLA